MKKALTIRQIRFGFNIAVAVILILFATMIALLYLRYDNALSETPNVEKRQGLLSSFRSGDFQDALSRLEKRRNLPDPAENARLPFGQIAD